MLEKLTVLTDVYSAEMLIVVASTLLNVWIDQAVERLCTFMELHRLSLLNSSGQGNVDRDTFLDMCKPMMKKVYATDVRRVVFYLGMLWYPI